MRLFSYRYQLLVIVAALLCVSTQAQLVANFTATPTGGCVPLKVIFSDQSQGNPDKWLWNLGEGTISTEKDPVKLYLTPGVYDITLTIFKGAQSVTITKQAFISAYSVPTINFSALPIKGCAPLDVQFTDKSTDASGSLVNWQWDFGDGNLGAGQNPLHTYSSEGVFKVTLTATNNFGCKNNFSIDNYIVVNKILRADFLLDYVGSCLPPVTVTFTDKSIGVGITSWLWDFGDGTTSNARNPTHTYFVKGTYDVKLTITNADGCINTYTYFKAVNVANLQADFTVPSLVCVGAPALFANASTPTTKLDSVLWQISDGTVSRSINLTKRFIAPGTYTITQTVYKDGCSSTTSRTITALAKPTAAFTSTGTTACKAPLTVQFTNNSVNGTVVKWDFGNGTTSTLPNPSVVYDQIGSYTVKLVVINSNGCYDTLVASRYVNVLPPTIDAMSGVPYDGCGPWTNTFVPTVTTPEPIISYAWEFGNGATSTLPNPTYTFSTPGLYAVILKIVTLNGCEARDTQLVRISPKANANFTGGPPVVCPSLPATFINASTGTITRYRWEFGDGGTSDLPNPTYKYNDTGYMNVRLIVYNNGCADTLERKKYIYVDPPIARFTDSIDCSDQFTHFFTNFNIGATSWKWDFGDGNTSLVRDPVHKYADTGVYKVSLYVDNGICNHTLTLPVYVLQQKANVEPIYIAGCKTSTVELTATGPSLFPSRILYYDWTFPGLPSQRTDTNFVQQIFSDTTTFDIGLKITDLNGCTDSVLQSIKIKLPEAKATFGPATQIICAGDLATFKDSSQQVSTNPVVKWQWFPDYAKSPDSFITSTKPPFSFQYAAGGTYDVKLIIVDSFGCTDSVINTAVVTVFDPAANFETIDTLVCLNTPVTFLNTSSTRAGTLWFWDFGDGTGSNTDHPVKSYSKEGKYDIRLVLREPIGCVDTLVKPLYVVVADAKADFKLSDSATTCPPFIVQFTNQSASNVINNWSFGNGNTSTLINPAHTYTSSGDFTVKLVIKGNGGCTDSTTRKVYIRGPQGVINYSPLTNCAPMQVQFTSTAVNTQSYVWDFSDGISKITNDSFTTHIYPGPGRYVPRVILEDGKGCRVPILGLDTIIVNDTPVVVAGPHPIVCLGQSTSLNASGAITYTWDPNPTLSCTNCDSPVVTPLGKTIYRVTGVDANGCIGTDTVLMRVMLPGTLTTVAGDTICIGEAVQLRAAGFDKYTWSPTAGLSNPNIPNPVARPTATTLYQITATDSLNCFSASLTVPIVVYPIPTFDIVESVIKGNVGTVVPIKSAVSPDVNRYAWTPASGLSCTNCPEPFATITNRIKYTATVSNAGGCSSQDEILIDPTCTSEGVFIPNTFSPNGDGNNDIFYPRGTGISRVKSWMIFNRWGELIYERKDFVLNDPTIAWNGTFRGRVLTPDVFVYTMELICGNNQTISLKGNVTLLK